MDLGERMRRWLGESHEVTLEIDGGTWRRVLAYIDRYNHECDRHPNLGDEDKIDPDREMWLAINVLLGVGIEAAEAKDGLSGTVWGELISKEVSDEACRRRRARRR
jgi:hypothetical protein